MLDTNSFKKPWVKSPSQKYGQPAFYYQKTLRSSLQCQGVGVHTGQLVTMTLQPAQAGTGILFVRTDVQAPHNKIPARWDHVIDTMLCTKIGNSHGVSVSTIEHLMAALYACEIDNVVVEIDGSELPIMDGSAKPFVDLIESAGIIQQAAHRPLLKILKTVTVKRDESIVSLSPARSFKVSCRFDFKKRANLATQHYEFDGSIESFKQDIIDARTFGFRQDIEKLWSLGLAKGGSLDNAVVIDQDQVLNPEGFRYPDECVRHKILDIVGDLYLAGAPIQGHFKGSQCGHHMQNLLLKALFADPFAWCLQTFEDQEYKTWNQHPTPPFKAGVAAIA